MKRDMDGLTPKERAAIEKAARESPTKQFLASWLVGYFGHAGGEPQRVREWKEQKLVDKWWKEARDGTG